MSFLFGKSFGTFTDLLKYQFTLLQLHWRDILKRTFDERGVPTKERDKHLLSFFCQRDGSESDLRVLEALLQFVSRAESRAAGGCGTIFKLMPTANGKWKESFLHAFHGDTDGGFPEPDHLTMDAGVVYTAQPAQAESLFNRKVDLTR